MWGHTGITGEGFSHLPPVGFSRDHHDDVAERLLTLKDGLAHPDPTILFHTCHSIAQVLTDTSIEEEGLQCLGLRDCPGSTWHLLCSRP